MTNSHVYELFADLCDHPLEVALSELDSRCAGDDGIREEVKALLLSYQDDSTIVDDQSFSLTARARDWLDATPDGFSPRRIGPYTLGRRLGEGYTSVVYASKPDDSNKPVALKVIRRTFASSESIRRFHREFDLLRMVDHPGIARAFEFGQDDGGEVLYIAMELVDGLPIDRYSIENQLSVEGKLGLLLRVCDAVAHMHQRGVIHRDIKPSNVLITTDGTPKILDFGIGRALKASVDCQTLMTSVGQVIGTLPYMSPEQAAGRHEEIDTRSDVYALGALFFKLLTGHTPFDMSSCGLAKSLQILKEQPARRMRQLNPNLAPDLDLVIAQALQESPALRFQSVHELTADVRRFRCKHPITARPSSRAYQTRRFIARHRAAVALSILVLIGTLAATSVTSFWMARSNALSHWFQQLMVAEALPAHLRSDSNLLDFAETLDPMATNSQKHQAVAATILGDSARRIGDHEAADAYFCFAIKALEDYDENWAMSYLNALHLYSLNLVALERTNEALKVFHETVDLTRVIPHFNPQRAAHFEVNYAKLLFETGHHDRAKTRLADAVASFPIRESWQASALVQSRLAGLHWLDAEYDTAESILEECVKAWPVKSTSAQQVDAHRLYLQCLGSLGVVQRDLGKFEQAESVLLDRIRISEEIYAEPHDAVADAYESIIPLYYYTGKYQEAAAHAKKALSIRRLLGPDHESDIAFNELYLGLSVPETRATVDSIDFIKSAIARYHTSENDNWMLPVADASLHRAQVLLGLATPDSGIFAKAARAIEQERGPTHPWAIIMNDWQHNFSFRTAG